MFLSIILYPLLHSAMNFCLKICFQQDPNFCMSMGQRYRYQRIPPAPCRWSTDSPRKGIPESKCEQDDKDRPDHLNHCDILSKGRDTPRPSITAEKHVHGTY